MSQLVDRVHARCEDCGQGYRVASPERTYECKQCGGTVVADEPGESVAPATPDRRGEQEEHHHLDGAVTCSHCHAINPHGAHFCEECGGILGASPPKQAIETDVQARREATDRLKHGFAWINGITWLYRLAALGFALGTLFAVLALMNPELPLGSGLMTVGLFTVLSMALVMGAIQVHFQAYAWAVVIASLATIALPVSFLSSGALSSAFLWSLLWCVIFWVAVLPTVRFRAIVKENPDLYIVHEIQGMEVRRSVEGRSHKDRHERLVRLLKKATKRAWTLSTLASGAFLVATVAGTYTVVTKMRAPLLAPVLLEFESAWNSSDLTAVGEYFRSGSRQQQAARLAAMIDGHGWTEAWPQIAEGDKGEGDVSLTVDYALDGGSLATLWGLADQRWVLMDAELPRPPFEPVVERFVQAWKSSSVEALAAFYPDEYRDRMSGSIRTSFERRGWDPFPDILETRISENDDGTMAAVLVLESGELSTEWLFGSGGKWLLRAFKLPKR